MKATFHTDSEPTMLERERAALMGDHDRRPTIDKALWSGIALSGGGIRSATFALGAMQALARHGLLSKFDYISSVSGGSYLSCSLQWWWAGGGTGQAFGTSRADFPYGLGTLASTESLRDTEAQRENLNYLSHHAHYLDPGNGLSILAGLGVVLRTVFVSLLVWLPLCILFFILTFLLDQLVISRLGDVLASVHLGFLLDGLALWTPAGNCWTAAGRMDCGSNLRLTYALAIAIFPVWAISFAVLAIVLGLLSRTSDLAARPRRGFSTVLRAASLATLIAIVVRLLELDKDLSVILALTFSLMGVIWLTTDLFARALGDQSYPARRAFQRGFATSAVPVVGVALLGFIPIVDRSLFDHLPAWFGTASPIEADRHNAVANISAVISVVSGLASSLYGYYSLTRRVSPSLAASLFASAGAFVFIYGLLLFAHMQALLAYEAAYNGGSTLITNLGNVFQIDHLGLHIYAAAALIIPIAAFLAITVNINHMGLHRFYRDRLMESFMPGPDAVRRNVNTAAAGADRFSVIDQPSPLKPAAAGAPVPYSLVNSIAILTNESNQTIAMRGGENLIVSPLFIGCGATGWASTADYIAVNGPLTLATAMAASGAAVNADAGYVGTGVTRGRLLSAAMSILNMRLGVWIANPRPTRWFFNRIPTYFRPMLRQGLLGLGHKRDSAFIELADGGHFDNLGLYELVRRKLGLIVVVDGEADSTLAMPGFVSVLRRISDDFGARVEFTPGHGVERFVGTDIKDFFPRTGKPANSPFLVARIYYKDGAAPGLLIYVKLAGLKDLDFTTLGYWAANEVFPYESTANQFFSVAQFEAYRNVGYSAAREMVETLGLVQTFEQPDSIHARYVASGHPDGELES